MTTALDTSVALRRSLSFKFSCMIVVILLLTLGIASYFNYTAQHEQLTQQLINRGNTLGTFIAFVSPDAILGYDLLLLDQYMRQVTQQEDVVYSVVVSAEDKVLTRYIDRTNVAFKDLQQSDLLEYLNGINARKDIIPLTFPIFHTDQSLGYLMIGMSSERVDNLSVAALRNNLFFASAITLILSIAIYLAFRFSVLRPVSNLNLGLRSIAEGDLQHRVTIDSADEIGRLGIAFNSMTESLQVSYQDLRATNEELIAATKAKSDFLANMSHEIRTPLTAIVGFGEYLLDETITPAERFSSVNTIIRNGNLLKKIINDILDLSKIEAGKLEIEIASTRVGELLQDIEDLIGMQARSKGLQFETVLKTALPERVETDTVRLKQILINLCGNAVKFTDQGKVTLEVSYSSDRHFMTFRVIDTGIGIVAEKLDTIFNPFEQADISTTRLYGGTGLGLTLVKRLALMLGGDISAQSVPGQGSVFMVQIPAPIEIDSAERLHTLPAAKFEQGRPLEVSINQLQGCVLLVVDDKARTDEIIANLSGSGLVVHEARDGIQTIKKLDEDPYDALIVDTGLRSVDAAELIEFVRNSDVTLPIISLRDAGSEQSAQRCKRGGCNEAVDLPLSYGQLPAVLSKYLRAKAIASDDEFAQGQHSTQYSTTSTHRLSGRVLLAEDTPDNQRLFSLFLKHSGIDLHIVDDGQRAVQESMEGDYDLVLMDMQMPIMGGLEATQKLRAEGFAKPIIALTANALKHDREAYFAAGCNNFISKPVTKKRLLTVLSQYLPSDTSMIEGSKAELNHSTSQSTAVLDCGASLGTISKDQQADAFAVVELEQALLSLEQLNSFFARLVKQPMSDLQHDLPDGAELLLDSIDTTEQAESAALLPRLESSRAQLEHVRVQRDWGGLRTMLPAIRSIAEEQNNLNMGCLCCRAEELLSTEKFSETGLIVDEMMSELQQNYQRLKNDADVVRLATEQSPLISEMDYVDDPELGEALNSFLTGLLVIQAQVNEHYSSQHWLELSQIMHNLKGTGGAFGFPLLTEVARNLHHLLRLEQYHKLAYFMPLFNNVCQRIIAGWGEAKLVSTG